MKDRSSLPEVFCKKGVLRNFAKFTGKHLCQSLFFNFNFINLTLLKKRLWHRCFPVNFAKFLRRPFLTEHLRWLLLERVSKILCPMWSNYVEVIRLQFLVIRFVCYPAPSSIIWPRTLSRRPSDTAKFHDISAYLKHVAWFTFSLLLWMQLFCLISIVEKFISVSPMLSISLSFSYN